MRVTSLSIGIYDYVQNDTLALLDLSEGDLQFSSIYVQENDRTQQYAALENLYTVTGGQFWSALYHTDGAEDLLALAAASSTTGDGHFGCSYACTWPVTDSLLESCRGAFPAVQQVCAACNLQSAMVHIWL